LPVLRINCFQESKGGGERGGTEAEPKGGGRTSKAEVTTGPRPGAGMSAPAGPREGEEPTGGGRAQGRSLTALGLRASTPGRRQNPKAGNPRGYWMAEVFAYLPRAARHVSANGNGTQRHRNT